MSERRRRRKKVRIKGIIRLVLFVALIIFFIYKLVQWNLTDTNVTYNLEYGEIPVRESYRALIIRQETILTSPVSGKVTQVSDDGDKVKKNQRIMEVTIVENMEAPEEMADVNTEAVADFSLTIEEVNLDIDNLQAEIAMAIREERYTDVHELSEALKLKIEKKALMNDGVLPNNSVVQTAKSKSGDDAEDSKSIITSTSGIVTYYIDGYEEEITYDNVFNLQFDEILSLDIEPYVAAPTTVYSGEPLYKIIDSSSYFLIIVLDKGSQNKFDIRSDLKISTMNKDVTGSIEEIFAAGNKVAIAIRVEEFIEDFYKDRFVDIELRQESYKGLKIKTSSLVKNEDGYGVFVVDQLNRVLFKPVKIITNYGEDAIVKEGNFYKIVDGENVIVDSVSIYDRVIIDSEHYEHGDTIK